MKGCTISCAIATLAIMTNCAESRQSDSLSSNREQGCVADVFTSISDLAQHYDAVLIGELHGTKQMPDVLKNIVQELSANMNGDEGPLAVALEYSVKWQDRLDAFFEVHDESEARNILNQMATSDGRTSTAMREMLIELWSLKNRGRKIEIFAVDYWPNEREREEFEYPSWIPESVDLDKASRDIAMGLNAVNSCKETGCSKLVYYAGNAHSRTRISGSASFNRETGVITEFKTAPSGFIIAHEMNAASIYLSHDGGENSAIRNDGFSTAYTDATTPVYAGKPQVFYCHPDDKNHDYVFNVGILNPSK